jgi:hypothetical protein
MRLKVQHRSADLAVAKLPNALLIDSVATVPSPLRSSKSLSEMRG